MSSMGKKFLRSFSPKEYFEENYGFTVNDSSFCIMPWIHTSTTTNGEFRLCCRSKKVWDVESTSIKEVWNHKKYNDIRKGLRTGQRDDHCSACWKMEDKGIVSLRQTHNFERIEQYGHLVAEWYGNNKEANYDIPIVEFKLSNLCNLKCRMCWPKDSTPWIQDWKHVEHIYNDGERGYINDIIQKNDLMRKPVMNLFESNETFIKDIEELLPTIREFEFAGGEPLMDPLHYRFLEKIPEPEKVILKYSTNLTDLESKKGRNVIDLWKKFKAVRITLSIDGYDELNAYIRSGSVWSEIVENVRLVKQELGEKLDYIKATTTISALNAVFLVETMEAIDRDMDIMWHTSRLQWPEFLHANVLPEGRLLLARRKLREKLETMAETNIREINNKRHIADAIDWINECINNNKHEEYYQKFTEFNDILDVRRNENFNKRG